MSRAQPPPPAVRNVPVEVSSAAAAVATTVTRHEIHPIHGPLVVTTTTQELKRRDGEKGAIPKTKPAENEFERDSRLAAEDLDNFIRSEVVPKPLPSADRLRKMQAEQLKRMRKGYIDPAGLVSVRDVPTPPKPITPPGPPNREQPARPRHESSSGTSGNYGRSRRDDLRIIRSGVMFGNLIPIPTDPKVDPPFRACFNCWSMDHRQERCPRPEERGRCLNCGRRGVTMTTCPRCAEPHLKDMRQRYGEKEYRRYREKRQGTEGSVERESAKYESTESKNPKTAWTGPRSKDMEADDQVYEARGNTDQSPTIQQPTSGIQVASLSIGPVNQSDPTISLAQEIRELKEAMEGLPAEAIVEAVRQLMEERRRRLDMLPPDGKN